MLPSSLVSEYAQYKEDTNAVASWLASTAESRGYLADRPSGASSSQDSSSQDKEAAQPKRLKGKARKQAKAAAAAEQAEASSSHSNYTIAIKDFIPLAEYVATRDKPQVTVPLSFKNTLNRVISTRSGFRQKLDEAGDSPDAAADSTHAYFVGVLQKVREVLTPRFASPPSRDAPTALTNPPSDTIGEVGGRFAGLSVDEPSEVFLNAPDIERPVPVNKDEATYVAESLQDPDEALFAYSLMVRDLAMIRYRIGWIWNEYRTGSFELVTAAIATNTACDLARHLMEDMTPMFEAFGGASHITNLYYLHRCKMEGFSRDQVKNDLNYETYEIATETYSVAFMLLENFLSKSNPGLLPTYKEGEFGIYDPTRDWATMSNEEKFTQDEIVLAELLCELTIVVRCYPNYLVQDELIRGLQEFDQTRQVPMYLAFAAQILLDTHHILRDKAYSGRETCLAHLSLMDEDLTLQMDFQKSVRTKKSPGSMDQAIEGLRKRIKWVQDDHVRETKAKVAKSMGVPCTAPTHLLMRYSPVIAGLMLYRFRTDMFELGLAVANTWGSLTFSLHLYNALKQEKILDPGKEPMHSWDDIWVAFSLLGKENFFVGEIPKSPEDYSKKLCLQMGMSAAALSNVMDTHILTRGSLASKAGTRYIKRDSCPVTDMFLDRYVKNTGQVDWTPEHVQRVLVRALHMEEESDENGDRFIGQIKDPEKLRERKKNIALWESGKGENKAPRMEPEQLIRSLALVLQAEALTMAFPYLELHRGAWSILAEVLDACTPLLLEVFGPGLKIQENRTPAVVHRILNALMAGDGRLLAKAGEVVKDQLRQSNGCDALNRVHEFGFTIAGKRSSRSDLKPGTVLLE